MPSGRRRCVLLVCTGLPTSRPSTRQSCPPTRPCRSAILARTHTILRRTGCTPWPWRLNSAQIAEALVAAGSVALRAVTVREEVEAAFQFAHDEVEVAVAVDVGERGLAAGTDVEAVEGARGAGLLLVARRRRGPDVLVIVDEVVVFAQDEVEVAVAVDVAERGHAGPTDVDAVEGAVGAGRAGDEFSGRADEFSGRAGREGRKEQGVARNHWSWMPPVWVVWAAAQVVEHMLNSTCLKSSGLRVEDGCLRLDGAPVAPRRTRRPTRAVDQASGALDESPRWRRRIILFLNREKVTGRRRP